jgi:hypothetical protein
MFGNGGLTDIQNIGSFGKAEIGGYLKKNDMTVT